MELFIIFLFIIFFTGDVSANASERPLSFASTKVRGHDDTSISTSRLRPRETTWLVHVGRWLMRGQLRDWTIIRPAHAHRRPTFSHNAVEGQRSTLAPAGAWLFVSHWA